MFSFFIVRIPNADTLCESSYWTERGKEMEEDFKVIDNYLMVKMPKEVDHHNSGYISKTADKFIMKDGIGNVVFDFEDTHFMDSSGIGIIMGRYKKISCFGGHVYVIHADQRIRRMLAVSGMLKIVTIMD